MRISKKGRDMAPNKLQSARAWCAAQFRKRYDGRDHPSFLTDQLLEEADNKFELGSMGVEGFTRQENMRRGVQYLNYGDPYLSTIVVTTGPYNARFTCAVGGWASYAEGGGWEAQ